MRVNKRWKTFYFRVNYGRIHTIWPVANHGTGVWRKPKPIAYSKQKIERDTVLIYWGKRDLKRRIMDQFFYWDNRMRRISHTIVNYTWILKAVHSFSLKQRRSVTAWNFNINAPVKSKQKYLVNILSCARMNKGLVRCHVKTFQGDVERSMLQYRKSLNDHTNVHQT